MSVPDLLDSACEECCSYHTKLICLEYTRKMYQKIIRIKICKQCKKKFTTTNNRKVYCSAICANNFSYCKICNKLCKSRAGYCKNHTKIKFRISKGNRQLIGTQRKAQEKKLVESGH